MKITICGSLKFAQQRVEIYHQLKKLGHQPMVHEFLFGIADGTAKNLIDEIATNHPKAKRKYNFIKWWYNCIKRSDAILVCNYDKGGIKNYIGGNTLMEMGFAHVGDKKIFLLNPVPDMLYTEEIEAMNPIIIYNDLTKIK